MSNFLPNTGLKTAFNELISESNVSFIEGASTYGFIPSNFRQFTSSGGSTGVENRMFKVSCGTSVGGYGAVQSLRSLPHRVGKGSMGRFSGYFTGGAVNSWQGIGLISIGEEISFGFNGVDFGVWHRYGGLSEVRTVTVSSGSGGSTNLTLTLNSVVYNIPLTAGTTAHNAYEISAWLNANQSVWGADQLNSTVIINALSDGEKAGTYSFAHGSATGSIARNLAGVTKTSNHTPIVEWNGSVFSGFNPELGNLYQIQYQNMGFGSIIYSIMNPTTMQYDVVHNIRYPNTSAVSGIPNPSLKVGMYVASLGSETNLDVYANSLEAGVSGGSQRTRNPRALNVSQDITTTNETTLITLRNRRTYNSYNNQVEIVPLLVTVANDTNRAAKIRVRAAVDIGSEQNFTEAGTNLVGDYDLTAVVYSGGNLLASGSIAASDSIQIDLSNLQISLPPSLKLIITVQRSATGGANSNFNATINWYEDL